MKNIPHNQNRRHFLKLLGAALVVVPVLAKLPKTAAFDADAEMRAAIERLAAKFDRLSIKGKEKLIEMFDSVEIKMKIKFADEPKAVEEVINELKLYFQNRLEAQKWTTKHATFSKN